MVYPGSIIFLDEFLGSLEKQTDKDFDLLLVNDGVKELEKKLEGFKLKCQIKPGSGTPASLRKKNIAWALESGFDTVIFADSDDTFEDSRVEISKASVKRNRFIFNELVLFGEIMPSPKPVLSARFAEGEKVGEKTLLDKNFLGLSNVALSADKLADVFSDIPDKITAYDWALFTKALHRGAQAVFTGKTKTFYRQHSANLASLSDLSDENISKGVRIKAEHYSAVLALGDNYREYKNRFRNLEKKIGTDPSFKKNYCDAVRVNAPKNALWWEAYKTEEELGL